MKNLKLGSFALLAVCLASFGPAIAQTVHHDKMDARAARADILKLQHDRKHALRTNNMGKVAQDDRLIAADREWIRRDSHKIKNGGG